MFSFLNFSQTLRMRKIILPVLSLFFLNCYSQKPGRVENEILLPNGWRLSPAGKSITLGDLPLNIAVASSKKYLAVTNNGQSDQCIQIVDVAKEKLIDSMPIAKSWYGLKFANSDKTLYASAGNDNRINVYSFTGGKLKLTDSILLG